MAVTMSDIAKDLDVSVVTVSKALRNKGSISAPPASVFSSVPRTQLRSPTGSAFAGHAAHFYRCLLLPDIRHPFSQRLLKPSPKSSVRSTTTFIISYFEEDPALETTEAKSLIARQVDGVISRLRSRPGEFALFEHFRDRKVPFVLIDRPMTGVSASFVGVDNEAIGKLATDHLICKAAVRIAHLRGPGMGHRCGPARGLSPIFEGAQTRYASGIRRPGQL